jgi:alpha-methylacyl-CoA racemase
MTGQADGSSGPDVPRTQSATRGPLSGIKVLDLSSVGPASRATRILADYGAEVVKVSAPPGRGATLQQPPFYAYAAHRGMRKMRVDLRDPEGRKAFLAMVAGADVVVESFRPGTADRLGIGYDDLRVVNAGLVYCSTTGYGQRGRRVNWAGHDLNYLAVGGYLAMSEPSSRGGPPVPGATLADAAAGGMHAALAVISALFHRASTGEGGFLDVSVTDGVLWLMSLATDEHLATGSDPQPGHDVLSGRYAWYSTYRTRDDLWLSVAAIEPKFFANLCRAIGCDQWIDRQYDDSAQSQIREAFGSAFASADRETWVELLAGSDACVAPVQSVAEVADDEDLMASGAFVEAKSERHGSFRQVGAVLAGMPALAEPVEIPDEEATDTDELLAGAGYDPDTITGLRERGIVA